MMAPCRIVSHNTHRFGEYRPPVARAEKKDVALRIFGEEVDVDPRPPLIPRVRIGRRIGSEVLSPVAILHLQVVTVKIDVCLQLPSLEIVLDIGLHRIDHVIPDAYTGRCIAIPYGIRPDRVALRLCTRTD